MPTHYRGGHVLKQLIEVTISSDGFFDDGVEMVLPIEFFWDCFKIPVIYAHVLPPLYFCYLIYNIVFIFMKPNNC